MIISRTGAQTYAVTDLLRAELILFQPARTTTGTAQAGLSIIEVEDNFRAAHHFMGMRGSGQIFGGEMVGAHFQQPICTGM